MQNPSLAVTAMPKNKAFYWPQMGLFVRNVKHPLAYFKKREEQKFLRKSDKMRDEPSRVLFFFPTFGYGGSEHALIDIMNHLDREKFKVGLCMIGYKGMMHQAEHCFRRMKPDIQIYPIEIKTRFLKEMFGIFGKAVCIARDYDLVVTGLRLEPFFVPYVAALLSGKKLIMMLQWHFSTLKRIEKVKVRQGLREKIRNWIEKQLIPRCAHIVAVSEAAKNDLILTHRVPSRRITVIYNPISLQRIDSQKQHVPKELFKENLKYIGLVARLTYEKNIELALQAFRKVTKRMKAKLLILGKGELRKELDILSGQMGIKQDVLFLGFQENPYQYIARCNVLVLSSVLEGFPLVLLEGMACGTIVVSADCPSGPRELIQNKVNGYLVPMNDAEALADAICDACQSEKAVQNKMTHEGLLTAQQFDIETVIKKYEALFHSVLYGTAGTQNA